jgi:hypothetical protein
MIFQVHNLSSLASKSILPVLPVRGRAVEILELAQARLSALVLPPSVAASESLVLSPTRYLPTANRMSRIMLDHVHDYTGTVPCLEKGVLTRKSSNERQTASTS